LPKRDGRDLARVIATNAERDAFYAQHRAEITRLRAQKTAASASQ
jgi:hypothetical protein